MAEIWANYAASRGFQYEPGQTLPSHHRGQSLLHLSLATLRGRYEDLPIVIRASEHAGRVRTRASSHAPVPVMLRMLVQQKAGSLEPSLTELPHVEDCEAYAREFEVFADRGSTARAVLIPEPLESLRRLTTWKELAFAYDQGLVSLAWLDDVPGRPAELDQAMALVSAACRWQEPTGAYR